MYRLAALVLLAIGGPAFAQPIAGPITGRWVGQWVTETNGHRGPLRANVTPAGDGYDVRFAGRFAKVIPFTYRQHLTATGATGDAVILAAERRLPLFGTFRMDATVSGSCFDARFTSGRGEAGRFILQR